MPMFSSPAPASGSRSIASNAFRNAGLIDKDSQMRDGERDQGGKNTTVKGRLRRLRGTDAAKEETLGLKQHSHDKHTVLWLSRRPFLPVLLLFSEVTTTLTAAQTQLATRTSPPSSHAGPSDPLSIRGASRSSLAGRFRKKRADPFDLPIPGAVEGWRQVVNKRYDPNTCFLNLDSLLDDELVKRFQLLPPAHGGNLRTTGVIFKLASQLQPAVQTLSLANNNLSGVHLLYLDKFLPKLRNLSLQNNALKTWKDLDHIGGRKDKLKQLRELVLLGNPLRDLEYKNGRGERYRSEIARRLLGLEVLDQEVITQIGFTSDSVLESKPAVPTPSATSFPFEMGPSFVTGVDGFVVSNFLLRFFSLFDSQRSALLDAYDAQANFSYSCNTSIPTRARIEGLHTSMPNQRKLTWEDWLQNPGGGSRNLNRPQVSLDKMVEVLHTGGEKIVKAQAALPGTKHDVQGSADKFVVDSFPVPHGQGTALLLTVHGEFMEAVSQGMRSFDRAFILVPASEGSPAKGAGWDVTILSDQLTIRGYSNPVAWKPGELMVQAKPPPPKGSGDQRLENFSVASLPIQQQQALGTLPEAQRNLVLQVCATTRLNANYAVECLNGNGWDFERAILNFEQVKETLPKDAFL